MTSNRGKKDNAVPNGDIRLVFYSHTRYFTRTQRLKAMEKKELDLKNKKLRLDEMEILIDLKEKEVDEYRDAVRVKELQVKAYEDKVKERDAKLNAIEVELQNKEQDLIRLQEMKNQQQLLKEDLLKKIEAVIEEKEKELKTLKEKANNPEGDNLTAKPQVAANKAKKRGKECESTSEATAAKQPKPSTSKKAEPSVSGLSGKPTGNKVYVCAKCKQVHKLDYFKHFLNRTII